ncbi:hypothetical protein FOZ61_003361 [Perkinsus olseni]|uniref:Dimethylglycine dehydrogenase, mitochondrial n=1 Tax=Perkinsus olseni TaxID=32597 RepID=A0A7J6LPX9_PEROL|nr:hypothetical protein FOZ61_003361 [Perkinsus olseni]
MFSRLCIRPSSRGYSTIASSVPKEVDTLIVGGGIIGVATAFQLSRLAGPSHRILLVEQNTLTSGTTWHAAGLQTALKGVKCIANMAREGHRLYQSFDEGVGWAKTGSLGIARTEDLWTQLLQMANISESLGIPYELCDASRISQIHPYLDTTGVYGGIYTSEDGIVNPADVTMAMATRARAQGAHLLERTAIRRIVRDGRRAHAVELDSGALVHMNNIIICAGQWSKGIVKELGLGDILPAAVVPHQYVVFDRLEGVSNKLPVVRDYLNKFYLKPEVGGFMVGVFESNPEVHFPPDVKERNASGAAPRDISHEVFPESIDKAGEWLEHALETVPALQEVGIKRWLHGPDTHSCDTAPIMGRLLGTDNVHICTGFNSQGIQCGAGAGLANAEWILHGYPRSFKDDFVAADVNRWYPALAEDPDWCEGRAAEEYGIMYGVHYPYMQLHSGRNRRLLPLHEEHQRHGARFFEGFGWERAAYYLPTNVARHEYPHSWGLGKTEWFEAMKEEARAVRQHVGVIDMSSFGKLLVEGDGAGELLQWVCTADIDRPIGTIVYTAMANERGGILADFTVTRLGEDSFYITTTSNQPEMIKDHLHWATASRGMKGVTINDVTDDIAVLSVMGPKSFELLSSLGDGIDLHSTIPLSRAKDDLMLAGVSCRALRVSYVGELGLELHVQKSGAKKLFDGIMSGGSIRPRLVGSLAMLDSLRMEKRFLHYGHDFSPMESVLQVGLGFACKLKTDVDFIGKAALIREKEAGGLKKRLLSLQAQCPDVDLGKLPWWGHGAELVYRNDKLVGYLNSAGYSTVLECPIGLCLISDDRAIIDKSYIEQGEWTVRVHPIGGDGKPLIIPVKVTAGCLFDPKGRRMRGDYTTSTAST